MLNLLIGMLDSSDSGSGWGWGGQAWAGPPSGTAQARLDQGGDSSGNSLEQDLIEVDLVDPAWEIEQLARRALAGLENGQEAALEVEMLRQQLEVCTSQGTALRPALLAVIARILGAAGLAGSPARSVPA